TSTPVRALSSGQAYCGVAGTAARTIGNAASISASVSVSARGGTRRRRRAASLQGRVTQRARLRDLRDQLVDQGLAERVEILRHQHERAGAAHHVLTIIMVEPARRIGVLGVPCQRSLAANDEAVDGDAFGERLVARARDVAAAIVGAVARYVDGAARGFERRAFELRHRE